MKPDAKDLSTTQAMLSMRGTALDVVVSEGVPLPTYVLRTQRGQSWTLSSWHGVQGVLASLSQEVPHAASTRR